ncbi:hypothetical protein Trydic_g9947 [Trypoxylus dichotomus]
MNPAVFLIIYWSNVVPVNSENITTMLDKKKEDFFPPVVQVKSNNKLYNGFQVNGRAVATALEANSNHIEVCGFYIATCTPVATKMKIIKDFGYLTHPWFPMYAELAKTRAYNAIPTNATECIAVSAKHGPILVTFEDQAVIDCSRCEHLDAIICDYALVGVLVQGRTVLLWYDMLYIIEKEIGKDDDPEYLKQFEDSAVDILIRADDGNTGIQLRIFYKNIAALTIMAAFISQRQTVTNFL